MVYDFAIVGAGIVGLAHAWVAAKAGKRVVVFDREAEAIGASVRNFGFVTITGQERGLCWERARRSRKLWLELAEKTDLQIMHTGLSMTAESDEAMRVYEAFMETEMGDDCRLASPEELLEHQPCLNIAGVKGGLISSQELRVEARDAIPTITAYLKEQYGVKFCFSTAVLETADTKVKTSNGVFEAEQTIICSGPDITSLYPDVFQQAGALNTKLQMVRVAPQGEGWKLNGSVMTETSLSRYLGFSQLPEADTLIRKLDTEKPWLREHGIHLIVVQSADGSLVIGDSHHEADSAAPFYRSDVEGHIMGLAKNALNLSTDQVVERWLGYYPKQKDGLWLVRNPQPNVTIASITGGMGMSTAFAFAEDTTRHLLS